jgi:hypothetical protein
MSWTSCNATPQFVCNVTFFFLLATMQQFTSLHLLQHISTCIFFVLQDFFNLIF